MDTEDQGQGRTSDESSAERGAGVTPERQVGATWREKVGKRRSRSLRFRRFVENYGETRNAYQAALKAGYSPKMAKARSYELARLAREVLAALREWRERRQP